MIVEHIPHRPSWRCYGCLDRWPCETSRAGMLAAYDPIYLSIYMWPYMEQAAGELPDAEIPGMFDRFLAWTGPVSAPWAA